MGARSTRRTQRTRSRSRALSAASEATADEPGCGADVSSPGFARRSPSGVGSQVLQERHEFRERERTVRGGALFFSRILAHGAR